MKMASGVLALVLMASAASAHEQFYESEVIRVVDGDTIRAEIDLGIGLVLANESIRLHGIDAPEKSAGRDGTIWLDHQIGAKEILVQIHGRDKFGRLLGTIWFEGRNINKELVENGFAVPYFP